MMNSSRSSSSEDSQFAVLGGDGVSTEYRGLASLAFSLLLPGVLELMIDKTLLLGPNGPVDRLCDFDTGCFLVESLFKGTFLECNEFFALDCVFEAPDVVATFF